MSKHTSPANLVKSTRQQKGMTQDEFASLLGKTQPLVSKYEAGKVTPSADVILDCLELKEETIVKDVSIAELTNEIKTKLAGDLNIRKRNMISDLIESISL